MIADEFFSSFYTVSRWEFPCFYFFYHFNRINCYYYYYDYLLQSWVRSVNNFLLLWGSPFKDDKRTIWWRRQQSVVVFAETVICKFNKRIIPTNAFPSSPHYIIIWSYILIAPTHDRVVMNEGKTIGCFVSNGQWISFICAEADDVQIQVQWVSNSLSPLNPAIAGFLNSSPSLSWSI